MPSSTSGKAWRGWTERISAWAAAAGARTSSPIDPDVCMTSWRATNAPPSASPRHTSASASSGTANTTSSALRADAGAASRRKKGVEGR